MLELEGSAKARQVMILKEYPTEECFAGRDDAMPYFDGAGGDC